MWRSFIYRFGIEQSNAIGDEPMRPIKIMLLVLCLLPYLGAATAEEPPQAGITEAVAIPTVAPPANNPVPAVEQPPQDAPPPPIEQQLQNLKKEVLSLNRDLFVLEEELLYPANTQLAVFVSLDVGQLFQLDAVELRLDDQVVTHYLYTTREINALRRGGVQRLYLGNVRAGKHELSAFFVGTGPQGRDYKRATTLQIEKGRDPLYVELRIDDNQGKQQPEFSARLW